MSDFSRRQLITTGLAAAAGVTGLGVAAHKAQKYGLVPLTVESSVSAQR